MRKKWSAGQEYSTSQNCGWVRFHGGPMDGERGLHDHNRFSSISFADSEEQVTHEYKPKYAGSWDYVYDGPHYWTHGTQLSGDPIKGWRRHVS